MKEKLIELLNNSFSEQYEKRGLLTAPHTATDLIANGVTVQGWIPASEPPKKNGKYLCRYVFSENYAYPFEQVLCYFATDKKPHFQHEGELGLKVTHWMPLPQPPKGE